MTKSEAENGDEAERQMKSEELSVMNLRNPQFFTFNYSLLTSLSRILLLLAMVWAVVGVMGADSEEKDTLTYDEFIRFVEAGKIKQVRFVGKDYYFTGTLMVDGKENGFICPGGSPPSEDPLLTRLLQKNHVAVVKEQPRATKGLLFSRGIAAEWKMAGGQTIKIGDEAGKIEIAGGKVLTKLMAFENVHQIIQSENKKALLLEIQKRIPEPESIRPHGGVYFDYAALIVIRSKEKPDSKDFEVCRVLTETTLSAQDTKGYVSELGSVDDDGRLAVIKVNRHPKSGSSYSVDQRWETWNLKEEKKVSEGLHLPK